MPKFNVSLPKVIWYDTQVEADTAEKAIAKSYDEAPGLCAQCSGWGHDWSISDDCGWNNVDSFESEVTRINE
jgi:hypothetical protein